MIVLALDTTAVTASVALLDNECVVGSFDIHNKLTHSEKLLPMIHVLLENSGYEFDDVDFIGVSVGPGSFTGVRIGVATAKGLAFPSNIPIVEVSSLEALAENIALTSGINFNDVILSPSMDARRNELYNALFLYDGSRIKRITDDRPISCEELEEELITLNKTVLINGDGAWKLYEHLSKNKRISSVLPQELLLKQSAVSVGRIALRNYSNGIFTDSSKIAPLYLRTSQAERVNNIKEAK